MVCQHCCALPPSLGILLTMICQQAFCLPPTVTIQSGSASSFWLQYCLPAAMSSGESSGGGPPRLGLTIGFGNCADLADLADLAERAERAQLADLVALAALAALLRLLWLRPLLLIGLRVDSARGSVMFPRLLLRPLIEGDLPASGRCPAPRRSDTRSLISRKSRSLRSREARQKIDRALVRKSTWKSKISPVRDSKPLALARVRPASRMERQFFVFLFFRRCCGRRSL